jgi:Effector Associated Constant Component 1
MLSGALVIGFPDASVADGNRLASTLAEALRDLDPGIAVERQRERSDTQDFGASLAVVLGTTAATAMAKGLVAWLTRNSGARIEIRRKGKVVLVATHLDSQDVPRIVEALSSEES